VSQPTTTLILCGGRGVRAYPLTAECPKPLLEVAGTPIVRHVMDIYAEQGFTDFVLAAGFRAEDVSDFAATLPPSWKVRVVDTGDDTDKAERIRKCAGLLDGTCFVTYSDGVGNVDLNRLLAFHNGHQGQATVTVVPLPSQYGTMEFDPDGRVHNFREKPSLPDHWINAGFFVFDAEALDHLQGDDLEGESLPVLGKDGELFAYRHRGFWKSMDTFKDGLELTAIFEEAQQKGLGPPWLLSATGASS
jgi:glucose-1-phosphate cytidylyltransferase